jgi:hypothetical protein
MIPSITIKITHTTTTITIITIMETLQSTPSLS